MEDSDADIVAVDFLCVEDETDRILQEKYFVQGTKVNMQALCELSKGEVDEVIKMHALTIRTSILKEHGITIDEHCLLCGLRVYYLSDSLCRNVVFYYKFYLHVPVLEETDRAWIF